MSPKGQNANVGLILRETFGESLAFEDFDLIGALIKRWTPNLTTLLGDAGN